MSVLEASLMPADRGSKSRHHSGGVTREVLLGWSVKNSCAPTKGLTIEGCRASNFAEKDDRHAQDSFGSVDSGLWIFCPGATVDLEQWSGCGRLQAATEPL